MSAIPDSIIIKSLTTNFKVIASDVSDMTAMNIDVGDFIYAITIKDIASKFDKYYVLAEYSSKFKYDYVCRQADNIVRVIGKTVDIYKAVKENDHTVQLYITDYSSDDLCNKCTDELMANLVKD